MGKRYNTYKEIVGKVKKIIDEWDPIDLLGHAPQDEYDSETTAIVVHVYKELTAIELANKIYDQFVKSFGADVFRGDLDECIAISNKILLAILKD